MLILSLTIDDKLEIKGDAADRIAGSAGDDSHVFNADVFEDQRLIGGVS